MTNVGEIAPVKHDALVSGEERALVLNFRLIFRFIFPKLIKVCLTRPIFSLDYVHLKVKRCKLFLTFYEKYEFLIFSGFNK